MTVNKMISVLIIANGQMKNKELLQSHSRHADCIIAANGGSTICYKNKIQPHYIIGDLDSIDKEVLKHFKDSEIIHIHDQNRHDLDKAIGFASTLHPAEIIVFGAFGKRLDHSLANLVFIQCQTSEIPLMFIDDYGQLSYVHGIYDLNLPAGRTVSLFSFLPVSGLTLEGFKYALNNVDFPRGFNGLSNSTIREKARISIRQGSLFIYCLHENTPT